MKSLSFNELLSRLGRSRKGAWIEILMVLVSILSTSSRSRKGAWIEIANLAYKQIKTEGRSRKGAWIEILPFTKADSDQYVAPARERGLKWFFACGEYGDNTSLPQGSVD